jgi:hypothetical protein
LKFGLVVVIFPNLVANDYKSHVVVNGLVTFWLISTSVNSLQIQMAKIKALPFHQDEIVEA